jgi:TcpE family
MLPLRTYTDVWRIEREITHWYDIDLPFPLSVQRLVAAGAALVPWAMLLRLLGVPFQPGLGMIAYLLVPGLAGYYATQPIAEGKRLHEYLLSWARYLLEPRRLHRLAWASTDPDRVNVAAVVWQPDAAVQAATRQLETALVLRDQAGARRWRARPWRSPLRRLGSRGLRLLYQTGLVEGRHARRPHPAERS